MPIIMGKQAMEDMETIINNKLPLIRQQHTSNSIVNTTRVSLRLTHQLTHKNQTIYSIHKWLRLLVLSPIKTKKKKISRNFKRKKKIDKKNLKEKRRKRKKKREKRKKKGRNRKKRNLRKKEKEKRISSSTRKRRITKSLLRIQFKDTIRAKLMPNNIKQLQWVNNSKPLHMINITKLQLLNSNYSSTLRLRFKLRLRNRLKLNMLNNTLHSSSNNTTKVIITDFEITSQILIWLMSWNKWIKIIFILKLMLHIIMHLIVSLFHDHSWSLF